MNESGLKDWQENSDWIKKGNNKKDTKASRSLVKLGEKSEVQSDRVSMTV